jgi:hypothetical protein
MDTREWLGVTDRQAFRFFVAHLTDVTDMAEPPANELLYNASVLAHFATTSTASQESFPACPTSLMTVFDLFVMDRSQQFDADIMEAAGSQCLLLTGFFQDQQKHRHQLGWYAELGRGFYGRAAASGKDPARSRLMGAMARHFGFWRVHLHRLAVELRDEPRLISVPAGGSTADVPG